MGTETGKGFDVQKSKLELQYSKKGRASSASCLSAKGGNTDLTVNLVVLQKMTEGKV